MRHLHTLVACAALILTLNGAGFAQQYSFRHYAAAEGLQNLAVLSLAQDGAGYIWAGSEGGLYRYDGTRFRLMAAAEGLPCTTEVHALHVAKDGALWANTCSRIFRFDGQRFHSIAGLSGMLPVTQSMANAANGDVLVATPSGLYEVAATGTANWAARPHPLGPELAGTPFGPSRATVRNSGLVAGGNSAWKPTGGFPRSGQHKDCRKITGTRSSSLRTVRCGRVARASCIASHRARHGWSRKIRISRPAPIGVH